LGTEVSRTWMPLDVAPNGAGRVCVAVAIKISLLRSCFSKRLLSFVTALLSRIAKLKPKSA
jgi:hypothetical protein